MSVNTPNMNLIQPTQGVDSGVVWEQSFNSDMGILDGHTHAAGSGVQIQPSGLNISSDLSFQSNNAISLRSTRYVPQASPLSLGTDLGCVYVAGADLYYNDTAGNHIRLTAGGLVNATSSGIASGTATASFSSGTLVVDENTNAPGNIQAASYLMGQTGVAGSNYLTLQPPASLSSGSYNLTLPPLPTVKGIVTLDSSGNFATAPTLPAVESYVTISSSGNLSATIPTAPNFVASSSGNLLTNSTSPVAVAALNGIAITTSGNPVTIKIQPDTSGAGSEFTVGTNASMHAFLYRDSPSNVVGNWTWTAGATALTFGVSLVVDDYGASAGSHTYGLFLSSSTASQFVGISAAVMTLSEMNS